MSNVEDIAIGATDGLGQAIALIYDRKPEEYCVYGVANRVMVCLADASRGDQAGQQRKRLAALSPLHGEIEGLIDNWRNGNDQSLSTMMKPGHGTDRAVIYDRRVADAMVVALEGDSHAAADILARIKKDILEERIAQARLEYLIAALATSLLLVILGCISISAYAFGHDVRLVPHMAWIGGVMLLVALTASAVTFCILWNWHSALQSSLRGGPRARSWMSFWPSAFLFCAVLALAAILMADRVFLDAAATGYPPGFADTIILLRASAAGAVGAFFSTAIGISGRTVLPDLLRTANLVDAALRIAIGFIGAGVLMALLKLQLITISLGSGTALDGSDQLGVLIIGFVAGFSERLVPDLLEKAAAQGPAAPSPALPPQKGDSEEAPPAPPTGAVPPLAEMVGKDDGEDLSAASGDDGCPSDHEVGDREITLDADLPAASGGVATARQGERP